MKASFRCDLQGSLTPLPHVWEHTIGSGHALLALRADWQQQLNRCHTELGFQHVRFHGLLSDDMGTLVREQNKLLNSFFNANQIIDFLLSIGMKPFVELSFMPAALASGSDVVFHYRGNVTPPKDYSQWAALVSELVSNWVKRYGRQEVSQWFFEVWNEPNQPQFWTGSQADYFELYLHTVGAIKQIDDSFRVGGPATSKNAWISDFLAFCESNRLPVDFVSTHHYPTDAFGNADDDTETQLAKSRRSVLQEEARATQRQADGLPVYYTEWNTSSNPRDPRHDEPYAAAFIAKTVMEANGLVDGYSFWTFTDIFEENYFPSISFHGGFGLLNLYGIAKPSYRAYEILHALGDEQWQVAGSHPTVDVWVVRRAEGLTVLITNQALPRHPIEREDIRIQLTGAQLPRSVWSRRIDEENANAKQAWKELGEPEYLDERDVRVLQSASELRPSKQTYRYDQGSLEVGISVAPQSVTSIEIDFAATPTLKANPT